MTNIGTDQNTGDPAVIKALQAARVQEAHLNMQYRHDMVVLKFMGLKHVACKIDEFGDDTHKWMKMVAYRLLFLGGDTPYTVGNVTNPTAVTATFEEQLAQEKAIVDPYEQAIQVCMKAMDDNSRNLFEHLIKWRQVHIGWLQKQLRLIGTLTEQGYINAQLSK